MRTAAGNWWVGLLIVAGTAAGAGPALAEITIQRLPDGTLKLVGRGTVSPVQSGDGRLRQPTPRLAGLIDRYARGEALDPRLVQAVIEAESAFDSRALSRKGAIGLMQLMPQTARELGIRDPWDPEQNIRGGARYLRLMLERFGGDLELALAGYNAGPSTVERHGGVPPYPETTRYVNKVLSLYRGSSPAAPAATKQQPKYRPFVVTRQQDGTLLLATPE